MSTDFDISFAYFQKIWSRKPLSPISTPKSLSVPSRTNLDWRAKTRVLSVFHLLQPIRQTIARPKASINAHFRGHFQPKSDKRTAIIAYIKIHVLEFAIFCNQFRKIIPPVGEVKGVLPSER